jgi:hypothetical protein
MALYTHSAWFLLAPIEQSVFFAYFLISYIHRPSQEKPLEGSNNNLREQVSVSSFRHREKANLYISQTHRSDDLTASRAVAPTVETGKT